MNILYGISGIGTGHSNRQLPIIEHFSKDSKIAIFCYGESYRIYSELSIKNKNIIPILVDIPFIAESSNGFDWKETARINKGKDFNTINSLAILKVEETIGKPDIVISDYEPLSAQYSYAYDVPLITIDQQSKYLCGNYLSLNGKTAISEIMRLRMFFPKANARIACSFFNVDTSINKFNVTILPPAIKSEILNLKKKEENVILLYVSSQSEFVQSLEEVIDVFKLYKEEKFEIFVKDVPIIDLPENVLIHKHGDNNHFYETLSNSKAIISTAGHTLLSEAMYLGIPVYAVPLSVYEQHMNANILEENGFGISRKKIEKESLDYFIYNLLKFKNKIITDKKILLRRSGKEEIIKLIEQIARGEK